MRVCPHVADRPGHEHPYQCRLPEGHALPMHSFGWPRLPGSETEARAFAARDAEGRSE